MTAIARGDRPAEPVHRIDVRCSARLPRGQSDEGRCQLFAGHDGPHAVMYAHCGERMVRTWTGTDYKATAATDPKATAAHSRTVLHRPWMYGYPAPAWFETEPDTAG